MIKVMYKENEYGGLIVVFTKAGQPNVLFFNRKPKMIKAVEVDLTGFQLANIKHQLESIEDIRDYDYGDVFYFLMNDGIILTIEWTPAQFGMEQNIFLHKFNSNGYDIAYRNYLEADICEEITLPIWK